MTESNAKQTKVDHPDKEKVSRQKREQQALQRAVEQARPQLDRLNDLYALSEASANQDQRHYK